MPFEFLAVRNFSLHQLPQLDHMPVLRRFTPKRHPDHPLAIQGRRCQKCPSGLIDPLDPGKRVHIERFASQTLRLVADANSL
jgi:hypothetical protein